MIEVQLRKRVGITVPGVKKIIARTLQFESVGAPWMAPKRGAINRAPTIGVLVTGDREIRRINKKFLNHDYATDVISFGMNDSEYLGDIVVSAGMARRTAKELKIPFREELARYLIHGTLHLLGYRDKKKKDHERMHERQEEILAKLLT